MYAVPSCPTGGRHASPSDSSTSAEEIAAPEYMWLANLLNGFGDKKGFELVCKVGSFDPYAVQQQRTLPLRK